MSTKNNLPEYDNVNEVDLVKILKYFEGLFCKIVAFFKRVFQTILKLPLVLFFVVSVAVKYFWLLGIAFIVSCILLKTYADKQEIRFFSEVVVYQGYSFGGLLYKEIIDLNSITSSKNYKGLAEELKIPYNQAKQFRAFEIRDNSVESDYREAYDKYLKTTDTNFIIDYEDYKKSYNRSNFPSQTITVYAVDPSSIKAIEGKLINRINENSFLKKQREIEQGLFNDKLKLYENIVNQSGELQNKYLDFLDKYYNSISNSKVTSDINLNINDENGDNSIFRTDYQLFKDREELSLRIVEIKDSLRNKSDILRIQKGFSSPVLYVNYYDRNFYKIIIIFIAVLLSILSLKELGFYDLAKKIRDKKMIK